MNTTIFLDRQHAAPQTTSDFFSRPMRPASAPLVYINGFPGVGKEAVAECLTLLLGRDKSLLVDVRGIGPSTPPDNSSSSKINNGDVYSPLTPEHPDYFGFDHSSSPSTSSTSPIPFCSCDNLARLLALPCNVDRIAALAVCAPDTPAGRATVRTFESAAARTGRLFVPVALTCEPAEHMRRANSLQRQCSLHKSRTAAAAPQGQGQWLGQGSSGVTKQRLANVRGTVTVDITRAPVFETALQIVELVNRVVAERDAELCGSAVGTPEEEAPGGQWKHLGVT